MTPMHPISSKQNPSYCQIVVKGLINNGLLHEGFMVPFCHSSQHVIIHVGIQGRVDTYCQSRELTHHALLFQSVPDSVNIYIQIHV